MQKNTHFLTKEYNDCHITNMKVTQLDAGLRANSFSFQSRIQIHKRKIIHEKKNEKLIVPPTTHTCYDVHICTKFSDWIFQEWLTNYKRRVATKEKQAPKHSVQKQS